MLTIYYHHVQSIFELLNTHRSKALVTSDGKEIGPLLSVHSTSTFFKNRNNVSFLPVLNDLLNSLQGDDASTKAVSLRSFAGILSGPVAFVTSEGLILLDKNAWRVLCVFYGLFEWKKSAGHVLYKIVSHRTAEPPLFPGALLAFKFHW